MMRVEKILQNPWVIAVLAIFCCALWGSAFPFIKIGYRLFANAAFFFDENERIACIPSAFMVF